MTIEEIEKMKADLKQLYSLLLLRPSISTNAIENALQYIEQLETEKQNVIEKLEEDIEKANEILNDKAYRYIEDVIDEQWLRKQYADEILSYMKGEEK